MSAAATPAEIPVLPAPANHIHQQLQANAQQALQDFKDEPGDLTATVLAVHAENLLESATADELTL